VATFDERMDRALNVDAYARVERRLAIGSLISLATKAVQLVLQMGSLLILAWLLDPVDFGLVGMATVVTGFMLVLANGGLTSATIQSPTITHHEASNLFWVNVILSVVLGATTAGLSPLLAEWYDEPGVIPVLLVLSVAFPLQSLFMQHLAVLQRRMEFGKIALVTVAAQACGFACSVSYALFVDRSHWALVVNLLASTCVTLVLAWRVCPWRPGRPRRRTSVRRLIAFGGYLTGFAVLNYFASQVPAFAIGGYLGAFALGIYAMASQLFWLPLRAILGPLGPVATSAFSKLLSDSDRYRALFTSALCTLAIVVTPLLAIAIGAGDWIIEACIGAEWRASAPIVTILAAGAVLFPASIATGWLFVSQARGRQQLIWGVIESSVRVIAILAVVALGGGLADVALTISARALLLTPVLFRIAGCAGPVSGHDLLRYSMPGVAGLAVALALIEVWRSSSLSESVSVHMNISVAVVLASVVVVLLVCITKESRTVLRQFAGMLRERFTRPSQG
jgi:PST family polysaccharide transporter